MPPDFYQGDGKEAFGGPVAVDSGEGPGVEEQGVGIEVLPESRGEPTIWMRCGQQETRIAFVSVQQRETSP